VVGTGTIGATLARRWRDAGLDVTLASRAPGVGALDGMPVLPVAEALPGADVVITAIPGASMGAFLAENAPTLGDTPLVDASNNVGAPVMHHAAAAGSLPYYRAFNTLGVENFADPVSDGITADLFYSGPERHKALVESLIRAVGLRPVWVGDGPGAADLLDGLTRLWFTLALSQGRGRHLAFRMLP
jgi:predicted dinucleotide-binding enzyme